MRRSGSILAAIGLIIGVNCGALLPVCGQQSQSPSSPIPSILESVPYDAAKQGPLIYVAWPGTRGMRVPPRTVDSLQKLAATVQRQVIPVGSLTVLAPMTMVVIEERLAAPDPFAGLPAEERFKYLLSLFTTDQWKLAGTAGGIGAQDLNEQQRALFLGLLPEHLTVQRTILAPTGEANVHRYENQGEPRTFTPAEARLRLVRKVEFQFSKQGADDYGYTSGDGPSVGEEHDILTMGGGARGDIKADPNTVMAFGVPILRTVPSRFKTGQLDFAAGVFQVPVPLDGEMKTLGDLLARVAHATGVDLTADKRLAELPLFLRIALGQKVRAGDVLKGLCWSVTGAFRHVGPSTYLLTDDVKGIGARFARLNEWAEAAETARYKAVEGLLDAAAKHNPLAYIGFAPGDPHALPPPLQQRVDEAYRKERYGSAPEMMPSDLPNALQLRFQEQLAFWTGTGVTLRTDRVRVGTTMAAQFVFPGGSAVEATFSQNIGSQYLQHVAIAPKEKEAAQPTAAAPPAVKAMPDTLRKRVLLARLPPEDRDLGDLLAAAKIKGFTEVWLHVTLDDGKAQERLKAAVAAGEKRGIAIGAAITLLRGALAGQEDVNIFGETGAEFAKRRTAVSPESRDYYGRAAGWIILAPEEAVRRLMPLVNVPGLCALALKGTAAPGWAGDVRGGDGIAANGHLGYGVATRLTCIHSEGLDPNDIAPSSFSLRIDQSLPFFPSPSIDGPWSTLSQFRVKENKREVAKIHAAVRKVRPDLPLYLDDRASGYADPNTRWFGRWDVADHIPVNPVYAVESEAREAAFAASPEPLLCRAGWNGKPDALARAFGETAQQAAANWRGVALDLTGLTPAQALRMLGGLPEAASIAW